MSTGSTRHICRHCSRFNPGSPVCRWCGVNDPEGEPFAPKRFAAVRSQAKRTAAREARFGPVPKGYRAKQEYWAKVQEAGL